MKSQNRHCFVIFFIRLISITQILELKIISSFYPFKGQKRSFTSIRIKLIMSSILEDKIIFYCQAALFWAGLSNKQ